MKRRLVMVSPFINSEVVVEEKILFFALAAAKRAEVLKKRERKRLP